MVFPEREDKKYILNCPVNLLKCSFVLRPAMNHDLEKNVVIMTPAMRPAMDHSDDPFPNIPFNPMDQDTSFVVWNTRGVNNASF